MTITEDPVEPVWIIVPDVPRKVRRALVTDAKRQRLSVNELAARILADHFGVAREPVSSTRFVPVTSEGRLSFRVPPAVRHQLRVRAAEDGLTIRGLVIAALAARYGIPFTETARRPRRAA